MYFSASIGVAVALLVLVLPAIRLSMNPSAYLTGKFLGAFLLVCLSGASATLIWWYLQVFAQGTPFAGAYSVLGLFAALYVGLVAVCVVAWFLLFRRLTIFSHNAVTVEHLQEVLAADGWTAVLITKTPYQHIRCSKGGEETFVRLAYAWGCAYLLTPHAAVRRIVREKFLPIA